MKITYYLEDGYAYSERRPHVVEIPDDEIQECETYEDYKNLIETLVKEDFENKVTYY